MPKAKQNRIDAKELVSLAGGEDEALFFLAWVKHDRNATKAYLELHPDCSYHSATVLASRMLAKVSRDAILASYDLDYNRYFQQLHEGVTATKWNDFTGDREADHSARKPYHDKLGKLLGIEVPDNVTNIGTVNILVRRE